MTKHLEDSLNLPKNESDNISDSKEVVNATDTEISIMSLDKDITQHDGDMDKFSEIALEAFEDIMEIGNHAEYKDAAKLFQVGAEFLKIATNTKSSKLENKLKAADLLIKAEKAQLKKNVAKILEKTPPELRNAEVIQANRNDILDAMNDINEEDDE